MSRRFAAIAVAIAATATFAASSVPTAAEHALRIIETGAFRAHVTFLADDLLEGRAAGTRGYDVAAAYVAAYFERLGLTPAGDGSSWFQRIPFVSSTLDPAGTALVLHREGAADRPFSLFDEFVMQPDPLTAESEIRAPVVFAGFGIHAPEAGWDDYANLDVDGKIVAILSGAPPQFPTTRRAHYSSSLRKTETAVRMGAAGILTLRGSGAERRYPWDRFRRQGRTPTLRWIAPDGTVGRAHPELRATATLGREAAEALFEGAPRSFAEVAALEERAPRSVAFPLAVEVTMRTVTHHARITSPNVAAMIEGSDPELAREVVVYTAHLDHIGITEPVDGDRINNGAFDNASGIAAILEAARAFTALPEPPRRSVLFLAVTAEEKGLLGSDYFARFPTVERERLVANINMDMFVMAWPLRDVIILGAEHSSLARPADAAAAHLGLRRTADPTPEESFFVRSDQYSFVRQGIPSVAINEGESSDPEVDAAALSRAWMRSRYHTPQDDLAQPIVWEMGRDLARYGFLLGYLVAQDDARPAWNEGDFFGETFGR